jgi:hypothetical protein
MVVPPAFIVHGLADARLALAPGLPATLLSAPGAALYAGCGWWQALIQEARAEFPAVELIDILDCADGAGQALAAVRIGVVRLILWPSARGRAAVEAIVAERGGFVLEAAPEALDLAQSGARRQVLAWLRGASDGGARDKRGVLG